MADCPVKDIKRCQVIPEYLNQNEIGVCRICLSVTERIQFIENTFPLGKDQGTRFLNKIFVLQHAHACISAQTVQTPWVLVLFQCIQESLVTCDTVAQTESRSCIELGYTAQDHQVIVRSCQRHGGNFGHIWSKFYIGLVNHYENIS